MPSIDVRKQTDKEFSQYSKDVLSSLIRSTFNVNDKLVFITYQPVKQQLDYKQVTEHTSQLFEQIKYIEVVEQTYKISKRYNSGAYLDSYHSHLIAKESDYNSIKDKLQGASIVTKFVYDINGLKDYLTKQAGNTINRILPTQNIPVKLDLPNDTITIKIAQTVLKKLLPIVMAVIRVLHYYYIDCLIRINKLERLLMYIDDT